ncbi:uncharacterized protein [Tursiops truncatus]|uniref:uncharacterized protein isoform X1 n=1 Tax=Tursiops truncatus TaxID=9739 RepID=UPI003CCFA6CD
MLLKSRGQRTSLASAGEPWPLLTRKSTEDLLLLNLCWQRVLSSDPKIMPADLSVVGGEIEEVCGGSGAFCGRLLKRGKRKKGQSLPKWKPRRYLIHLEFILAVRPALHGQLWPKHQWLPVLPDVIRRIGWTASTWYLGRSRKAWTSCGRLRPRAARTGNPSRRSSSPTVGSTCERAAVSPGNRQPRCPICSKQGFVSWPFLGVTVGQLLCRHGLGRLWLFPKWGRGPGCCPPHRGRLCVPFPGQGLSWARLCGSWLCLPVKLILVLVLLPRSQVPGVFRGCTCD